jgi:endonuclease YncB( thermonuclease family)
MKLNRLIIFWVLFILLFSLHVQAQVNREDAERIAAELSAPQPMRTVVGKVVGVHDGDTITLLDADKRQYKIRFNGIDAPELKQDFGQKSKENLSNLVFGKEVTLRYNKIDKYRRIVGNIYLDGKDINLEQIKAGFAWHYKKYQEEQTEADRKAYAEAEIKARNAKLGLWSQPKQTPPWDWRKGTDNENLAGVPEGSIIGNKNSMIYHTPGCSTYAKVSAQNRQVFKTEEDAIKAGYRISGACESNLPKESQPKREAPSTPTGSSNSNNNSGSNGSSSSKPSSDRTYVRGPRGGCYYINSSGKKTYVDKSLCS